MKFQFSAFAAVASRSPLACFIGFSLGVIAIRFVPRIPTSSSIVFCALLLIVALCRWRSVQMPAVFLLGLCWAGWHAATFQSQLIPVSLQKKDLVVVGTISSVVTPQARGFSFDFQVQTLKIDDRPLVNPGTIRLSSYEVKRNFSTGQRWRFTVRLKRPRSLVNPGMGFDYAAWSFSKGMTAKGYIVKGTAVPLVSDIGWFQLPGARVSRIREEFSSFLARQMISPQNRSVFGALSVGIRDRMEKDTWRVLRDTGTAHLVAISGLHIGLVALIAGWIGGLLWRITGVFRHRVSRPVLRWSFGLATALLYAVLAGFPLPTQRAVVMLAVAALVVLCRKSMPAGWVLSIVVALILLLNPLAPLASSFWLSFIAVVILMFSFRNSGLSSSQSKGSLSMLRAKGIGVSLGWCQMQSWLFIGMVPVLLISFQQISLVSPVANLISVPVIGLLIVPAILLSMLVWSLGFDELATLLISLCSGVFEIVWHFLSWLSEQSVATWQQGAPASIAVYAAIAGFLLLIFARNMPWRWLAGIWLLPLFFMARLPLDREQFRLTLLDVGQGLASVVQTQNHTLVFDVGAKYSSGFDMGVAVVVPFLRTRGVEKIDRLLVSHADNDHAGGVQSVIAGIDVDQLFAGEYDLDDTLRAAKPCRAGQSWHWDGVSFTVLWPIERTYRSGNDASCVVRVSSRYGSLLLTGDIEGSVEKQLLSINSKALSSDLLQVPHHGSLTSSTEGFIRAVNPRIALNSSGYLNRFGHPHPTVKRRYVLQDIPFMATADHGAIEATFNATGIHVTAERAKEPRFWRDNTGSAERFSLSPPIVKTPSDIITAG